MKTIKNMHELALVKQKLKYKEALIEKELMGNTTKIVGIFTDKLKNLAFDVGMNIVLKLFTRKEKKDFKKV